MDDFDEYVDSVLYGGSSADDTHTPYGANGTGAPVYGVVANSGSQELEAYEGQDRIAAERIAVRTYRSHHGKADVSVLLDGGTWMSVKHVPGDLSTAQLCEPSGCLHPQCGQINPLSCYCVEHMDAETRERYRTTY